MSRISLLTASFVSDCSSVWTLMNANTAAPATSRMPIKIATGLNAPRLKLPSSEANAGLFIASSGSDHAPADRERAVGWAARYRKGRGREAAKKLWCSRGCALR